MVVEVIVVVAVVEVVTVVKMVVIVIEAIASYHLGIIREDRTGVAAAVPQLQSPGYRER